MLFMMQDGVTVPPTIWATVADKSLAAAISLVLCALVIKALIYVHNERVRDLKDQAAQRIADDTVVRGLLADVKELHRESLRVIEKNTAALARSRPEPKGGHPNAGRRKTSS